MRPNLPRYVGLVRAKGSDYLYFRRHGQRWRLPDDPATPEFQKAYLELLGRTNFDPVLRRVADGSVAALVRDYRGSDEFIRELRKGFAGKGRTQQLFGQVASLLFNFAVDNDYCETNPASRMKRMGRARAYRAWTDAECGAFEASNPVRHVMTGYMLGRYTGQRRGDVFGRISPTYLGTRSSSLSKPGARRDKLQQGLPQGPQHDWPRSSSLPWAAPHRRRSSCRGRMQREGDHGSTRSQDAQYGAEVHRRCAEEALSDKRHRQA